jgi:glutamate-1-semialdehyde 2,1-aminomutase
MDPYDLTRTLAYNARLRDLVPGAVHSNFRSFERDEPVRFVAGRGSRLTDLDGNEYLDLSAQFGAMILGHADPRFAAALARQLARTANVTAGDQEVAVAERLAALFPSLERVRFGLSGSEVVQNVVRLARAATGRRRVVRFEGHFHGSGDALMGGRAGDPANPVPAPFKGDPYDTEGRDFALLERDSFLLPWNRVDVVEELVARAGDDIAAILTEPIAVNGGGLEPEPGYLARLRELCDRHGIVLVFDEVITGCRVGPGGAQAALGVRPDLTILGKALSNGVPISAFGGRRDIMDLYAERRLVHGGTYNGHPLGLAAIAATLDRLAEDGGAAWRHMADMLARIEALMLAHAERREIPLHFRGPATIGVFHGLAERGGFRDYFDVQTLTVTTHLARTLGRYGVLVCPTSRLYPNLALAEADLDFLDARVAAAWDEAAPMLAKLRPRKRR